MQCERVQSKEQKGNNLTCLYHALHCLSFPARLENIFGNFEIVRSCQSNDTFDSDNCESVSFDSFLIVSY